MGSTISESIIALIPKMIPIGLNFEKRRSLFLHKLPLFGSVVIFAFISYRGDRLVNAYVQGHVPST